MANCPNWSENGLGITHTSRTIPFGLGPSICCISFFPLPPTQTHLPFCWTFFYVHFQVQTVLRYSRFLSTPRCSVLYSSTRENIYQDKFLPFSLLRATDVSFHMPSLAVEWVDQRRVQDRLRSLWFPTIILL